MKGYSVVIRDLVYKKKLEFIGSNVTTIEGSRVDFEATKIRRKLLLILNTELIYLSSDMYKL